VDVEVLQFSVEVVFDSFRQVTVEAMLMEDLDIGTVFSGERNSKGSVRNGGAVVVHRGLCGVADGVADQRGASGDSFDVNLRLVVLFDRLCMGLDGLGV
jgi:hypothetical protein